MTSQPAAVPVLPTLPPMRSYAQANPIDLTQDDEEDDEDETDNTHNTDRLCKRVCTQSRGFNAAHSSTNDGSARFQPPYHSGLSPAMLASSLVPEIATPSAQQWGYPRLNSAPQPSIPNTIRPPPFTGPSNSAAFFAPRSQHLPPFAPLLQSPQLSSSHSVPNIAGSMRQIIDLTTTPSPPPAPHRPSSQPVFGNLPNDLPPKTPVCIGQLSVTALVLYPIAYIQPQENAFGDAEWAPVRLHYEHAPHNKSGNQETVNIRTPSSKAPNGEVTQGEVFAVVEQKAATHLGPLLGKGLIRLDAKVRKANRNVS